MKKDRALKILQQLGISLRELEEKILKFLRAEFSWCKIKDLNGRRVKEFCGKFMRRREQEFL